jgi:hypothetical protein
MTQYILKSALILELERRIKRCAKQREDMLNVHCYTLADDASARMGELRCFQDFLDTIEVKEMDLIIHTIIAECCKHQRASYRGSKFEFKKLPKEIEL